MDNDDILELASNKKDYEFSKSGDDLIVKSKDNRLLILIKDWYQKDKKNRFRRIDYYELFVG